MSSVLERPSTVPVSTSFDVTHTVGRLGHVLAAVTSGALLWVVQQLLGAAGTRTNCERQEQRCRRDA